MSSAGVSVSVEGSFSQTRESVQRTTTADVTGVARPSSLRGPRTASASVRRSSTIDEIFPETDDTPPAAAAEALATTRLCSDRAVQTSFELLQPLIGNGLRQRRRPSAAVEGDTSPRRDSLDDLVCRPWRRHSLSSLGPLSPRLASPVDDSSRRLPGDLILDDLLGDESVRSLSPLSIAEMTSPPRRWRRFDLQAPAGAAPPGIGAFPLRCYDADDGGRRRDHPSGHRGPNYVVGLPPSPQPPRLAAPPLQRAPLKRQKPNVGAFRGQSAGSSRPRGVFTADVELSPVSSGSSGAGGGGRDDGGDSSEGAGAKSLSTVSLEDAICRSMRALSDDDDAVDRRRRGADVTARSAARNNATTGTARSRRPNRPVVLSSDV